MFKKTLILFCPECGTEREKVFILEKKGKVYTDDAIEVCNRASCGATPLEVKSYSYDENYDPVNQFFDKRLGKLSGTRKLTEEEINARDYHREVTRPPSMEELREQEERRLKKELRRRFFLANMMATEKDFERLYPQLRDEYLMENTRAERDLIDEYVDLRYGRG